MKRHLGVSFSYFYLCGSGVLIITAIYFYPEVNNFGIVNRFGLPNLSEQPYRIIVAVVSLFIIYGYSCLRLKKRGLSFMIIYSFGIWLVSYFLLLNYTGQPLTGNLIWSIIVIIYFFILNKVYKSIQRT